MTTQRDLLKIIGLGSLLALAVNFPVTLVYGGPGPQFWQARGKTVSAEAKGESPTPSAAVAMVCATCKTRAVLLAPDPVRLFPRYGRNQTLPDKWGFQHSCGHCGGSLTANGGKMTNAMQGNCEMCGKDAARCVAAQHPAMTA